MTSSYKRLRLASANAVVCSHRKRIHGPAYTSVIYSHRDCCLPRTKDAYARSGGLQCTVPCLLPLVARLRYSYLRRCPTAEICVLQSCKSMQVAACASVKPFAAMCLREWRPQARAILVEIGGGTFEAVATAARGLRLTPAQCEVPLPQCFQEVRRQVILQKHCGHLETLTLSILDARLLITWRISGCAKLHNSVRECLLR